jgi:hypothetical protein
MRASILLSAGVLAAAVIAPPQAAAQVGGQAWCLQGTTGALNCIYDNLAQCQQAVSDRSLAGSCLSNPAQISTTGRGGADAPRGLDAPRGTGPNSLDRMPAPVR